MAGVHVEPSGPFGWTFFRERDDQSGHDVVPLSAADVLALMEAARDTAPLPCDPRDPRQGAML